MEHPWEGDIITFNPTAMLVWPYAVGTAAGEDLNSYGLFTLFPSPPAAVNGHAAFMQFIRGDATRLVAVMGNPPSKGPRVVRNDWNLYTHLTFSGTPGGPNSYFTPVAAVERGHLVMRLGGTTTPVDNIPPSLLPGASGHEIRIVAANRRFVVTWFWRASDRFAPAVFYVHDRRRGKWRGLKFSWNLPQSRIFGRWLATIAVDYEEPGSSGVWRDDNFGHNNESSHWVKDLLPDVRLEFTDMRMYCMIPGLLILDNLVDGRRITIHTGQEDSEILAVRKDGLVLYRVNDEIFSAKVEGDKLGPSKLVVKGEDVPEVHWAFWLNAQAEPAAEK